MFNFKSLTIQLLGVSVLDDRSMVWVRDENGKLIEQALRVRHSTCLSVLEHAQEIGEAILEEDFFAILLLDEDLDVGGCLRGHGVLVEYFELTKRLLDLDGQLGGKELQEFLRVVGLDLNDHVLFLQLLRQFISIDRRIFLRQKLMLGERDNEAEVFNLLFNKG